MPSNVNIKPADKGLFPHSYNPMTVMSLDFGELICSRVIECEKSDKWESVKANGFLRMAPLDFPAYGRAYIKSGAFFVPYYQILQNIDGFRSNKTTDKGEPVVMPHFKSDILNDFFGNQFGALYSTVVWSGTTLPSPLPDRNTYDFVSIDTTGSNVTEYSFRKLNYTGKRYYKLFKSLGYDFATPLNESNYNTNKASAFNINALNMLAFLKVYTDYFLNIHMYDVSEIVKLLRAIKDGKDFYDAGGNAVYNGATGELTFRFLVFLTGCYVPYESNMYLNAWNDENNALGVLNSQSVSPQNVLSPHLPLLHWVDTSLTNQSVRETFTNSTVSVSELNHNTTNTSTAVQAFSQLGLNSLGAIFDFVRRNELFGSESAKQAFARLGIKGDDYNTYFSRKLYEDSQQIDFSAVMSNSNTTQSGSNDGSLLGAYAGVGLGSMNFDYNYECSDYGVILNLNWLQFNMLQLHGFDPSVLRMHSFDWFTPQFDGKAQRAIPMCEITSAKVPILASRSNTDTNIFGFVGIYDEYRNMRDVVLGEFCSGYAKNFLFARDMSVLREKATTKLIPQSNRVQYMGSLGLNDETTDPFQFDQTNGDRFYIQFLWDIKSSRPILSTSDSLMLNGSGDLQMSLDSSNMA